jgi:hypothetical protein
VKTTSARIALLVWILVATAALAHLWIVRPDLGPQLPPAISLWLLELYGSSNGEELRDLESLVALACSFLAVLLLTASSLVLWRRLGKSAKTS